MAERTPFTDLIDSVEQLAVAKNPLPLFDGDEGDLLRAKCHFTTSVPALEAMSRTVESMLGVHPGRLTLIAGFQRLSHFRPYLPRYERLSARAKELYVIGVSDEDIQPWAGNVHILTEHAERVERNWFALLTGKAIHLALVAEQTGESQTGPTYRGFYTDSDVICRKTHAILARLGLTGQGELFGNA